MVPLTQLACHGSLAPALRVSSGVTHHRVRLAALSLRDSCHTRRCDSCHNQGAAEGVCLGERMPQRFMCRYSVMRDLPICWATALTFHCAARNDSSSSWAAGGCCVVIGMGCTDGGCAPGSAPSRASGKSSIRITPLLHTARAKARVLCNSRKFPGQL